MVQKIHERGFKWGLYNLRRGKDVEGGFSSVVVERGPDDIIGELTS